MFSYADENDTLIMIKECEELLTKVEESVKETFTLTHSLFGVNEHSFVTKDLTNGVYDLHYLIIIEKDKQGLIEYPVYSKNVIVKALNKIKPGFNFDFYPNKKSVINTRLIFDNGYYINMDITLVYRNNTKALCKLLYNNYLPSYMWFKIKDTRTLKERYDKLINDGHFKDLKDSYIVRKNQYLYQDKDSITSFQILLDSINEIWTQYYE